MPTFKTLNTTNTVNRKFNQKYRAPIIKAFLFLVFGYCIQWGVREFFDWIEANNGRYNSSYASDVEVTPVKVISQNTCTGGKSSTCSYTVEWPNGDRYFIQSYNAYAPGQTIYRSAWLNSRGEMFQSYDWHPKVNTTPPTWLSKYFMKDNHVKK